MKIYIAGKISGLKPYTYFAKFGYACTMLKDKGHSVINPVELCDCLYKGNFDYEDYIKLCFAAIEICDAVYMLNGWEQSPGASREHERAKKLGKQIYYQEEGRDNARL